MSLLQLLLLVAIVLEVPSTTSGLMHVDSITTSFFVSDFVVFVHCSILVTSGSVDLNGDVKYVLVGHI